MMGSSTLSALALSLAIFTASARAQGYPCTSPKSCSDCPTNSGGTGGPYVAQMFCDGTDCFSAYQCYFQYGKNSNYGAPDTTWDTTQGVSVVSEDVTCCNPPTSSCDFPIIGTGEGLVNVDASGVTQSATDTTDSTAMTSDTWCPVYCVDCAGGKYTSDNSSGNPVFTCDRCGNDDTSAQDNCIPPVPDTCTSASNPITAGQCRVEILQYLRECEAQDWWAFNMYFYDAVHMPFYMTGNVSVPVNGTLEIDLSSRLQEAPLEGNFTLQAFGRDLDLLGLQWNGIAWGAYGDGSFVGDYVGGVRNVTSYFACA